MVPLVFTSGTFFLIWYKKMAGSLDVHPHYVRTIADYSLVSGISQQSYRLFVKHQLFYKMMVFGFVTL